MGWDRRVLPKDRDTDETFPWMGIVALVVIVGGMFLILWYSSVLFAEQQSSSDVESYLSLFA